MKLKSLICLLGKYMHKAPTKEGNMSVLTGVTYPSSSSAHLAELWDKAVTAKLLKNICLFVQIFKKHRLTVARIEQILCD